MEHKDQQWQNTKNQPKTTVNKQTEQNKTHKFLFV